LRPLVRTSPAAFLSCLCASMPAMSPITSGSSLDSAMQDAFARLKAAGVATKEGVFPALASGLWSIYSRGVVRQLQRKFTAEIEAPIAAKLLKSQPHPIVARLRSCAGKWAGTWLQVLPSTEELQLQSVEVMQGVRFRLGLPPRDGLPADCPHCSVKAGAVGALWRDPQHFHSCRRMAALALTDRHNWIRDLFCKLARAAGCAAISEPRRLGRFSEDSLENTDDQDDKEAKERRPDVDIAGLRGRKLLDIGICHPAARSYAARGAARPLAAAGIRETAKTRIYEALARAEAASFHPVIIESYGAWGPSAVTIARDLAREAAATIGNGKAFLKRIRSAVSIALVRGNAHVARVGCGPRR
jgi:hypothetical protein